MLGFFHCEHLHIGKPPLLHGRRYAPLPGHLQQGVRKNKDSGSFSAPTSSTGASCTKVCREDPLTRSSSAARIPLLKSIKERRFLLGARCSKSFQPSSTHSAALWHGSASASSASGSACSPLTWLSASDSSASGHGLSPSARQSGLLKTVEICGTSELMAGGSRTFTVHLKRAGGRHGGLKSVA